MIFSNLEQNEVLLYYMNTLQKYFACSLVFTTSLNFTQDLHSNYIIRCVVRSDIVRTCSIAEYNYLLYGYLRG